jgi:enoyl-CoA hydratase/carnithine racemase
MTKSTPSGAIADTFFKTLHVRSNAGVLFIEIQSPPMNLVGPELVSDLVRIIRILDEGTEYKVAVFSSADANFFVNHVDVSKIPAYREEAKALTGEASLGLLFRRLSTTKAITIAKIAGRVRGAGSEFALACDMRFASKERAIFGQIESSFGVVPGGGAVQHLTRLMGRGRAMEVLCGAQDYSAEVAERYGWVNRALPDSELDEFVESLAYRMATFPHDGLVANKDRVNSIALASVDDYRADSTLFGTGFTQAEVQRRAHLMLERGLQKEGDFELNFGREVGHLED